MFNRIKDESSQANTIEFLIMILLIWGTFLMMTEFGFYFLNRNIVTNAAQNGARLVAVYGGTNGNIKDEYGVSTTVEYSVRKEIEDTGVNENVVKINSIQCGPGKTTKIGERTFCKVAWQYNGFTDIFSKEQVLSASSESEVIYRN